MRLRERLVAHEMALEQLAAERVHGLLVATIERRRAALRERGERLTADAGFDSLVDVGVPRVLRVPVAGCDEQDQLAQPEVQGRLEANERTQGLDLVAQLRAAQPDQERPADLSAPTGDPHCQLALTRAQLVVAQVS